MRRSLPEKPEGLRTRFHLGLSGTLMTQEPLSRLRRQGFRRVKGVKEMPAIVLIGAQWGDEGKGKATDLLGDRVQYVVSTRAATTPATPSSSATRSTHCTCSLQGYSPQRHAGDRQWRGGRP